MDATSLVWAYRLTDKQTQPSPVHTLTTDKFVVTVYKRRHTEDYHIRIRHCNNLTKALYDSTADPYYMPPRTSAKAKAMALDKLSRFSL